MIRKRRAYGVRRATQTRRRFPFAEFRGFTLIETMVAISLLSVSIVAPITLVTRSLQGAYYARDQVTAFFLAHEAIESVRAIRDHNIMEILSGTPGVEAFTGIPTGLNFLIDTRSNKTWTNPDLSGCIVGTTPLKTSGTFYAHGDSMDPCDNNEAGWTPSNFHRHVRVTQVPGSNGDELRVNVTVTWTSGVFGSRTFSTSENMYRYVE